MEFLHINTRLVSGAVSHPSRVPAIPNYGDAGAKPGSGSRISRKRTHGTQRTSVFFAFFRGKNLTRSRERQFALTL
jgi:hypothetical protein